MKRVAALTAHFYRWHPAVMWSTLVGVSGAGIAAIGELTFGATEVHLSTVSTAIIGVSMTFFGVPFVFAPRACVDLFENRHLARVPRFHLCVGQAAITQTLLLAGTFALLNGLRTEQYGAGFAWAFVVASGYFWAVAGAIRVQALPIIVMGFVLAFSLFAIALPELQRRNVFGPATMTVACLAACLIWARQLLVLRRHLPSAARAADHEALTVQWANRVNRMLVDFSPQAAILGYPVRWGESLRILCTSVIVVPLLLALICALILVLMVRVNASVEANLETSNVLWFTLILGAAANGLLASNYAAAVSRSRLLWLRGLDRYGVWRLIDATVGANLVVICVLLTLVAVAARVAGIDAFAVMLAVAVSAAGWSYMGIANRIDGRIIDWILLTGLVAMAGYALLRTNVSLACIYMLFCALAAVYYRIRARRLFLSVDWHQLHPDRRTMNKSSMVSLW